MKTFGSRHIPSLSLEPSAELLLRASKFNDSMQALTPSKRIFMEKGWKSFKTHEEANAHWDEAVQKRLKWAAQNSVFKKL